MKQAGFGKPADTGRENRQKLWDCSIYCIQKRIGNIWNLWTTRKLSITATRPVEEQDRSDRSNRAPKFSRPPDFCSLLAWSGVVSPSPATSRPRSLDQATSGHRVDPFPQETHHQIQSICLPSSDEIVWFAWRRSATCPCRRAFLSVLTSHFSLWRFETADRRSAARSHRSWSLIRWGSGVKGRTR
jgi:hypothetical protein